MNKKLVFFFASALAVAGCAKEPQADNSAVSAFAPAYRRTSRRLTGGGENVCV